MSWKSAIQVFDLGDDDRLEMTCRKCGHFRYLNADALKARKGAGRLYLDEVERRTLLTAWLRRSKADGDGTARGSQRVRWWNCVIGHLAGRVLKKFAISHVEHIKPRPNPRHSYAPPDVPAHRSRQIKSPLTPAIDADDGIDRAFKQQTLDYVRGTAWHRSYFTFNILSVLISLCHTPPRHRHGQGFCYSLPDPVAYG